MFLLSANGSLRNIGVKKSAFIATLLVALPACAPLPCGRPSRSEIPHPCPLTAEGSGKQPTKQQAKQPTKRPPPRAPDLTTVYEKGLLVSFGDNTRSGGILDTIKAMSEADRMRLVSEFYQSILCGRIFAEITVYEIKQRDTAQGLEYRIRAVNGNHVGESLKAATRTQLGVDLEAFLAQASEAQKSALMKFIQEDAFIAFNSDFLTPVMESVFTQDKQGTWKLRKSSFVGH